MHNIPVLTVTGQSLAEGYEQALVALYQQGIRFRTQYDKPGDPLSLDATLNLTVLDPLAEPMIHKAFPGGIEDLREYVLEVQGIKDHWVKNINDPADTRWEYTYHGRLASYGSWQEKRDERSVRVGPFAIDQVQAVIDKLARQPFTRQAQMITWMPNLDLECYDPPCLQSIWYRLVEEESVEHEHPPSSRTARDCGATREREQAGKEYWLNCNIRFRSNDAWGASFMNMFGFVMFNREVIAAGLAARLGRPVNLGRLNWQADSYHIYGKDIADARQRLFDRLAGTTLADRSYRFDDEMIQDIYREAEAAVRAKIAAYDQSH